MIIAKVKFGRTHAVLAVGDKFRGKQTIDLACATVEITNENRHRYELFDNTGEQVGCTDCRRVTGLEEDQNAN